MTSYISNPNDVPIVLNGPISFSTLKDVFGTGIGTTTNMKFSYVKSDILPLGQTNSLGSFRGKNLPDPPLTIVANSQFTGRSGYEEVDTSLVEGVDFNFRKRVNKIFLTSNVVVQPLSGVYDGVLNLETITNETANSTVSLETYKPVLPKIYENTSVSMNVKFRKRNAVIKTLNTRIIDANDVITQMKVKYTVPITSSSLQTYHGHHHASSGYGGNGHIHCTHTGSDKPQHTGSPANCHVNNNRRDGTHHSIFSCGGNGTISCSHTGGGTAIGSPNCSTSSPNNGHHHSKYSCGGNGQKGSPSSHDGYHHGTHTLHSGQTFHNHVPSHGGANHGYHCNHCFKHNRSGHGLYTAYHDHSDCYDHYAGHRTFHGCHTNHHATGQHQHNCVHDGSHANNCNSSAKTHHSITYRDTSASKTFTNTSSDLTEASFTSTLASDTSQAGSCFNQRTLNLTSSPFHNANPHTSVTCTSRYKLGVKPSWTTKTYEVMKGVSIASA